MVKKYYLIEYYIKGLDPDEQRGIAGELRDKFTPFQQRAIDDIKNNYKNVIYSGLFLNEEQVKRYLQIVVDSFIKINERMIKNERYPLFQDPYNLPASMEWRDKLVTFMPESECNKIVGCKSFHDYKPSVYKKNDPGHTGE